MSDWRLWRTTCEFCGQRVTIGAAGRVYKHNDTNGKWCEDGSWVLKIRPNLACPACSGVGHYLVGNFDETCPECEGTGQA